MEELMDDLLDDLSADIGIKADDEQKLKILSSKIKNAIREVKEQRNYQEHHTDDFIASDLNKLYSNIRALAMYDWNKRGVEGQSSHSSNGTSRGYEDRAKCFNGIIPFADVI